MRSKLLTTSQALTLLPDGLCSRKQLQRLLEDGKHFPNAFRLGAGKHWHIPESDVASFLKTLTPKARRAVKVVAE